MQIPQQFSRIPTQQAANLPRLKAPAGYVVVIQDVDYGNRFKIARLQRIDRDQIRRVADLSIETRLALILEAENAAGLALELHDRFAGRGSVGEWFDLDDAGVGQFDEIGRPQALSLRELALNEMGAESLVQDAKIVRTAPESPFAYLQPQEKRPARRWTAWLILLLIVALLALVVTRGKDIRREISRLLDSQPRQAAPTGIAREAGASVTETPTIAPGQGEIFYVRAPAPVRGCARTTCPPNALLEVGFRLVSLRYQRGEPVKGDTIWIAFAHKGRVQFVHRSQLSTRPPIVATTELPTQKPALTATPLPATDLVVSTAIATETATATPTETATLAPTSTFTATATEVEIEVLVVETVNNLNARVRACPSTDCEIVGRLRPGDALQPSGQAEGETVNDSGIWIEFEFQGEIAYIHSSLLTRP